MPFEREQLLPLHRVPHLHSLILTCGANPRPVRTETNTVDTATVPVECQQLLPRHRVPHLHRPIHTCGANPRPVRAARHAADRFGVSFKCEQLLPRHRVPKHYFQVRTRRGEPGPVRVKTNVNDKGGVSCAVKYTFMSRLATWECGEVSNVSCKDKFCGLSAPSRSKRGRLRRPRQRTRSLRDQSRFVVLSRQ